jgi:pimeloyl-ACP methyl ester carboxylesterase
MAATGYVVVIADYPGFGESKDIPHPYLVAEPTVRSLVDLLFAVKEMDADLPDITVKNEYFLIGYSQGGWSTLELHKALELEYSNDFSLKGTCCGAGPYDISVLLKDMMSVQTYPEPVYIGYIMNAYKAYDQFTNPVSDILQEPYASRISTLYNGTLNFGQINAQLTTSIPGLMNPGFLTGYATDTKYAPVREAVKRNSVSAWQTNVPLLMVHGGSDTQVFPVATESMYAAMIQSGSSPAVVKKVIIPGADHSDGVAPAMIMGFWFLNALKSPE